MVSKKRTWMAAWRRKAFSMIKALLPLRMTTLLVDVNRITAEKYRVPERKKPQLLLRLCFGIGQMWRLQFAVSRDLLRRERDLYGPSSRRAAPRPEVDAQKVGALQDNVRRAMVASASQTLNSVF